MGSAPEQFYKEPTTAMRPTTTAFTLLLATTACSDDGRADASTSDASTTTTIPGTSTSTDTDTSTGEVAPTSTDPDPLTSTSTSLDPGTSSGATSSSDTTSSDTGSSDTSSSDTTTGSSSGGELRVLQLNLCHSGVAGCFKGDAVMTKAVEVIGAVAPGFVTLNEVCRADVPWLAEQTGAVDSHFTPALRADDSPVKCKNGDDYGNGLLSWFAPAWAEPVTGVYAAQSSMTERRVWICMGYADFTGCTTHLSTDGDTALTQCEAIVGGPLATAAADGPAVMAGDWNLKYNGNPDAQDCVARQFYRKGDGAVQHVIASDDLAFLETVVLDMDGTTDHPGLEVRLTFP